MKLPFISSGINDIVKKLSEELDKAKPLTFLNRTATSSDDFNKPFFDEVVEKYERIVAEEEAKAAAESLKEWLDGGENEST